MGKAVSKHKQNKKELQPLYQYLKESERKRRKDYDNFLETASDRLFIPGDVIAGQSVIHMKGTGELSITNYRSIEEYSTEQIKLELYRKSMIIQGERLMIEYFRKDEIKIVGIISTISFVR